MAPEAAVRNTKFIATMVGTLGLLGCAVAGRFTGELGAWVATIVCAYCGANAVITRAALVNGKETPQQ